MNYILITGCLGFIGGSFTNFFLKNNKNNKVLGIDKITYAADYKKIKIFEKNKNFKFLKIDISDYKNLKKVYKNYNIIHVINIAAETHVDNSIKDPDVFINSNIVGTYNLLKLSQNKWQGNNYKKYKNSKFLQISTCFFDKSQIFVSATKIHLSIFNLFKKKYTQFIYFIKVFSQK